MVAGPAEVAGQIQSGRLRGLATTRTRRSPGSPNLPTVAQASVPKCEFAVWHILSARSSTPPAIPACDAAQGRSRDVGLEPGRAQIGMANSMLRADLVKWATVSRETGLQGE